MIGVIQPFPSSTTPPYLSLIEPWPESVVASFQSTHSILIYCFACTASSASLTSFSCWIFKSTNSLSNSLETAMNLRVSYHSGLRQCHWKERGHKGEGNKSRRRKERKRGGEKKGGKNILSSGMSTQFLHTPQMFCQSIHLLLRPAQSIL
jgi:hypothetical protein